MSVDIYNNYMLAPPLTWSVVIVGLK
jgi:hypothetical protein